MGKAEINIHLFLEECFRLQMLTDVPRFSIVLLQQNLYLLYKDVNLGSGSV